jgi:hypothetical protein
MDLSDKLGKTGIVELWVPYTVAEAIVNFMYLKKCIFGPPSGKSYFFVDINGKALSQDAMYRHTVVIEMFAVMGIRVTATQNRHGFCTTQRLNDCKGSTGVGNKIDTQEEIYNDRTEEIGIKNKMIANRKILEKEAKARTHLKMDAGRKDFFEKQQLENTALGRKMMLQEAEDKEFDKSKNETRINGGKQKIFPRQRFDLLRSIFRLDSVEWTCLWVCGDGVPKNKRILAAFFERYLFSNGKKMDEIRQDIANIASHYPTDTDLFYKLTCLIYSSFRQG